MNIVKRLRAAYRALTLGQFKELGLLDPPTYAGVTVTPDTALTVSSYWDGLNVIAGDIGVLDRFLYRRLEDGERERASTHPVYKLLHDEVHRGPGGAPQTFWQTLTAHALSWGNGYAEIEWDNALRPIALWPIPPDQIAPMAAAVIDTRGRKKTDFYYLYRGSERIEPEDIIHIAGLGFDGIRGYSVLSLMRQSLGLDIALDRFGAAFFGNGAWPGIALQHPHELGDEAQKRLRASLEDMHRGPEKAHRLIILEEGMTVSKPISIPPEDAQFLATKSFQIEDMARWMHLPPHKLRHKVGERPGGNLESSQIEYLQGTLLPWTKRIEQETSRKLIPASQRGTYYVEHLFEALLKVDTTTRVAAEEKWVSMGALSPERVAQIENFPKPKPKAEPSPAPPAPAPVPPADPPVAPAVSDARSLPEVVEAVMRASVLDRPRDGQPLAPSVPTPSPAPAPALLPPRVEVLPALRALIEDRLAQYVRREAARMRQAAKGPATFGPWIEPFYERELPVLVDLLKPLVRCRLAVEGSSADADAAVKTLAQAHVSRSREDLLSLSIKNLEFEAERLAREWEKSRPGELADQVMALRAEEDSNAA